MPGFDGLDGVSKCLFQNALADGPEHEAEHPPFEVLALAYHIGIHIGRPRYYQRASNGPVRSRPARRGNCSGVAVVVWCRWIVDM